MLLSALGGQNGNLGQDFSVKLEDDMMREVLSTILVMFLLANLNSAWAASQVDSKSAKTRVLAVPVGPFVDVRLNGNEKIRGRMGEVSDEGFVIQTVQGGKVENRKIAFTDLVAGIGVVALAVVLALTIRIGGY